MTFPASLSICFRRVERPQAAVDEWLRQAPGERLLILEFGYAESWQQERQLLWLLICCGSGGDCRFSVTAADRGLLDGYIADDGMADTECRKGGATPAQLFDRLLETAGAPDLSLGAPLRLQPVHIAKPWGQEIWYTGIEQRGVSRVGDGRRWFPISWLLAALPGLYGAEPPVLLKILDPLPDELFGDLYFELHQKKREVYIVTGVDESAWPDGAGAIRYGFDPELLASYPSTDSFRRDYLNAVAEYRQVRLEIDRRLDRHREAQGIAADAPVPAAQLREWLDGMPAALLGRERDLRAAMERFTRLRPLRVGDVVRVPLLTPHSLQHGVRTVEFQTPVYERLILSFGQKVLTQPDWDTRRAAELMNLEVADDEPLPVVRESADWREHRIVDFPDFEARRLQFSSGGDCILPALACGGVAMSVAGTLRVGGVDLQPEQAVLLPLGSRPSIAAHAAACLLWAQPGGASGLVE